MKRLLFPIITVLAVGALATACDASATPQAATVNGATIATNSLNQQLRTFDTTAAGQCLLSLEDAQASETPIEGTGGSGTYDMAFTDSILDNNVGNVLAGQYAASKGLHLTSAKLATTEKQFESTLDGEISAAASQASEEGEVSFCEDSSGEPVTGAALLAALPAPVRKAEILNQAVDTELLTDGANLSSQAVTKYYHANQPLFEADCVSWIVAASEADANQYVAQIKGGASFASVAKAHSLDSATASSGGALGCTFTQSQVEQALGVTSAPVGTPLAPLQDPSSSAWDVYEVTSQKVESLAATTSLIKQELLEQTANVNRVSKEIVGFARRSDVSVDPQYGTWKAQTVVAPVAPPAQYLLAAVSGQPKVAASGLGGLLGGSGSSGSTTTPTTTTPTTSGG